MRYIYEGTFKDGNGNVVGAATTANNTDGAISVFLAGTETPASVYTAASGGTAVNSVSTDDYGYFYFYVDDTDYDGTQLFDITLSHAHFESRTYEDISIIPYYSAYIDQDVTSGSAPTFVGTNFTGIPVTGVSSFLYYADATATDQGAATAGGGASIKDLVDAIDSKSATIVLLNSSGDDTTTYTLTTSETIPSTISLLIEHGAVLDGAGTLTIEGPFRCGLYQCFGSSITILFGDSSIRECYPQWWGAVGDGSTDDTDAINAANAALNITYQQYGQTASNQKTLYFPSGIYIVTPGGLDYIQANIDASNAVFKASEDSSGHILHIREPARGGVIKIRAIIGSQTDYPFESEPTRDDDTLGLRITNCHAAEFNIGAITGCGNAIMLDSYYGDENNATSDNIFYIDRIWFNSGLGIVLRSGTNEYTSRSESNQFHINYMVANGYGAVWLDSTTNEGGKIQDNHFIINTLECHYAANEIGIYLTGENTFNNKFDVLQATNPSGTGKLILNGDGVNNIFNIPISDWSLVEMGNDYNIYRTQTRSIIYGTAAPAAGRWRQGDICFDTGAAAEGTVGWVCTTTGTPGTWKAFGTIAA